MQIRSRTAGCRALLFIEHWGADQKKNYTIKSLIIKTFQDMKTDHPKSNADSGLIHQVK